LVWSMRFAFTIGIIMLVGEWGFLVNKILITIYCSTKIRFSTNEEKRQNWPLDTSEHIAKGKSFTTADFFHYEFGGIIEHLFLSSDAFGVMLNDARPWFLRRVLNHGDPILCVAVSNAAPYPKLAHYDNAEYFDIQFLIKTAKNIRIVRQA